MTATITPARAQSTVQRAYVYIVALVAVHMIVLGVANLLRVFAEIALGAPSGGFTGLPFVFADFNRPRDLYREQASLAIALLLVGTPAWWWHFRLAQRVARAVEERASALRSLYVHLVVFVTALLTFGYGQRALRLVLQGLTFGSGDVPPGFFGLEPEWPARAAGGDHARVHRRTSGRFLRGDQPFPGSGERALRGGQENGEHVPAQPDGHRPVPHQDG